ncbi:YdcF family protein [Phormidium nigroviride]
MRLNIGLSRRRYRSSKTSSKSWFLMVLLIVCWFGFNQIKSYWEQPQALFVLGGAAEREVFAAKFAREHPQLPIWVSSGSNPEYAEWVFAEAGIDPERLHLDYRAVDTVTNFTTLVDELKAQGIHSVYLITSDDHMRRARIIGEIVLGSRGISFKAIPVPSGRAPEPIEKVVRDGVRAIVWLTTGYTGASLGQLKIGNR